MVAGRPAIFHEAARGARGVGSYTTYDELTLDDVDGDGLDDVASLHPSNLYILNEDKRVVVTQRPHRPDLDIGEILVPGDYPIVLYRKRRRALIEGCKEPVR